MLSNAAELYPGDWGTPLERWANTSYLPSTDGSLTKLTLIRVAGLKIVDLATTRIRSFAAEDLPGKPEEPVFLFEGSGEREVRFEELESLRQVMETPMVRFFRMTPIHGLDYGNIAHTLQLRFPSGTILEQTEMNGPWRNHRTNELNDFLVAVESGNVIRRIEVRINPV